MGYSTGSSRSQDKTGTSVCVCEEGGVRSKGQGGCVRDNGVKGCSKTSVCVHVCVWSWFAARQ